MTAPSAWMQPTRRLFHFSSRFYLEVIDWNEATTHAGPVAATAAGATALGLGGSAVVNALAQTDALPVRREELEEDLPQQSDSGDPPDLPQEDSPQVSLSLYKPFET